MQIELEERFDELGQSVQAIKKGDSSV